MKPSTDKEVREMYDATADSYAKMMDREIELPVYSEVLGRLQTRIEILPGTLIDTACGSGHMLAMFHDQFDSGRTLLGVDLSPRMVALAAERLGEAAQILVGDMGDLNMIQSGSAAAVMNFFAVHHLDSEGVGRATREWHRILGSGGQLLVTAWEGAGLIDYGEESDIVAFRYTGPEVVAWAEEAGFIVSRCVVEPVEGFPMDAVYLECFKSL